MLLKNDGYFLLELLLSLSAWFMLGLYFLPLMIDLTNQSRQLEVINKANLLLFEELHAKLIEENPISSYVIFDNGVEYQIYWRELSVPSQKEVCVKVENNTFLPKTELCKKPE
jgi:competence protein ComGE